MQQLANGQTQIFTAATEEDLVAQFNRWVVSLQNDTIDWEVLQVQPAMLVVYCQGKPEFTEVELTEDE